MTYIIDNAMIVKEDKVVKTSLLVNDEKILSVQPSFPKYRYMKMDTKNFVLTPSFVFFSDGPPNQPDKSFFIKQFLQKGATTVVASTRRVESFRDLSSAKDELKNIYLQSPLDFVLITKVNIKHLSVPFIQRTKREKIPAIIVQYEDLKQIYRLPWGWIREAMFPYNSPLVPEYIGRPDERSKMLEGWNKILSREKIPHLTEPLPEGRALPVHVLKKIGVYPLKGYLQTGGELSYNLFLQEFSTNRTIPDMGEPVVTVHKGKVIRVLNRIYYNVVKGDELIINRPSFFN